MTGLVLRTPLFVPGDRPDEKELVWARGVVEAAERAGGGAFAYEGHMVDAPVIAKARQLLSFIDCADKAVGVS